MAIKLDVAEAFRELGSTLNHLKGLLEWHKLSIWEQQRPMASVFEIAAASQIHVQSDLIDTNDLFFSLAIELHLTLERGDLDCTPAQRKAWRRRLEHLEPFASARGADDPPSRRCHGPSRAGLAGQRLYAVPGPVLTL